MSKITRFAARDPGPDARMAGFLTHLRAHGLRLGVGETDTALRALTTIDAADPTQACRALKAVCCSNAEDWAQFDTLFDSYWRNDGRVRQKVIASGRDVAPKHSRSSREAQQAASSDTKGTRDSPETSNKNGDSYMAGDGKLIASTVRNLMKKDLRELVSPEDIREAERVARRLAQAFADRRSRRRKQACRGSRVDLRRVMRHSLATGGEPIKLAYRRRPDRAVKLTAICDVSGSMTVYAKIFLSFLAGLVRADNATDAYLFHTRLVRITEALRDDDPLRALNRLTLLADGFGGGSKIGGALDQFSRTYARKFVTGRSVVIVLSDGYDTDPPELLAAALTRLKKRGCKVIWLNPLKGWSDYAPVARGMAAALPHLDLFAAANTLDNLASLTQKVSRL
jgi:uncharacterized protein with von Willebrand factor type A (vWA) domain